MRESLIALLLVSLVAVSGCESPAPAAVENFKPIAAAIIATESDTPAPVPSPPSPGVCPDCNGRGRVGDGTIMVTCLRCDGTGRIASTETPSSPPPAVVLASDAPAGACGCVDCTCDPCLCHVTVSDYKPYKVGGVWRCEHQGRTLEYVAVRCFGPGNCEYGWQPVKGNYPEFPDSSTRSSDSSARALGNCASGNCGPAMFAPRRVFGRRR